MRNKTVRTAIAQNKILRVLKSNQSFQRKQWKFAVCKIEKKSKKLYSYGGLIENI